MKNSVNLNSAEWCDLIFRNKNKSYGAYALRLSSGKRHLLAFGVVVLLMALCIFSAVVDKYGKSKNAGKRSGSRRCCKAYRCHYA